jgi:hypothetical protein
VRPKVKFMKRLCLLVVTLIIAGCGQTATASPLPTPTPTVAPTTRPTNAPATVAPLPTPAPTVQPAPTPAPTVASVYPSSYAALSKRQWARVVKAPDDYKGNGYKLWGCITQFDAATGTDAFRADASYRKEAYWYTGTNTFFNGNADGLADFVQGDIIFMDVMSLGSYSYDTQNGGNTTVPLFLVMKIKRSGSCD